MGLHYPVAVQQKLVHYIQLLARWNKTFNLTAVREVTDMVSRHLLDSLAVEPFVEGSFILDVGTGAGLPGIPLAIARPGLNLTLLDSNGKKTRFLQQAKIELGLDNIEVAHARVENYHPAPGQPPFDVIIARAFAATDKVLALTGHLQTPQTTIMLMQGKLDETISRQGYTLLESNRLEVAGLDAERHLLEIRKQQAPTAGAAQ